MRMDVLFVDKNILKLLLKTFTSNMVKERALFPTVLLRTTNVFQSKSNWK